MVRAKKPRGRDQLLVKKIVVLRARGVQRRIQGSERPPPPFSRRERCGKIFYLLFIFIVVREKIVRQGEEKGRLGTLMASPLSHSQAGSQNSHLDWLPRALGEV